MNYRYLTKISIIIELKPFKIHLTLHNAFGFKKIF